MPKYSRGLDVQNKSASGYVRYMMKFRGYWKYAKLLHLMMRFYMMPELIF